MQVIFLILNLNKQNQPRQIKLYYFIYTYLLLHFLLVFMKARPQRTHFMGYSNRITSSINKNTTADVFQKSFNKSKSQYYSTNHNPKSIGLMSNLTIQEQEKKVYNSQMNINSLYQEASKGHHHQFDSKRLKNQKNFEKMFSQSIHLAPLPLNLSQKLNSQITQIKNEFKDKEVNLYKLSQLKKTFLRNNQNRRNLKQFFSQFAENARLDKSGFKKMIKSYGYDINDHEVGLIFRLNSIHDQMTQNTVNPDTNTLDLAQFVTLMTKDNIYFKTLKFHDKNEQLKHRTFRFDDPDFQVFRNKFPKLKEALKIHKDQKIDQEKFEKIMKKIDITDLIVKQEKRRLIFNEFANQKGQLNVERLLGVIATQQHERISRQSGMRLPDYDNFSQNLKANEEFLFEKNDKTDPLVELLYPANLKKASFVDFERNVKSARQICQKLKSIKSQSGRDITKQIVSQRGQVRKDELFKKVEKILQSQGYNFSKNEYKSFLSYLDFDKLNHISCDKLETILFNENQKQMVDRLDRRKRNQDVLQRQPDVFGMIPEDQFVDKIRAKSSANWTTMKKTFIKYQNVPEFKVPTKFSAWPERLYQTDLSLMQPSCTFGMGISQNQRFQKDQKHYFGQEERLRRLKKYESKVKRVAEWSQLNQNRILSQTNIQQKKQLSKQYNKRLLKEQYEERCHMKSLIQ